MARRRYSRMKIRARNPPVDHKQGWRGRWASYIGPRNRPGSLSPGARTRCANGRRRPAPTAAPSLRADPAADESRISTRRGQRARPSLSAGSIDTRPREDFLRRPRCVQLAAGLFQKGPPPPREKRMRPRAGESLIKSASFELATRASPSHHTCTHDSAGSNIIDNGRLRIGAPWFPAPAIRRDSRESPRLGAAARCREEKRERKAGAAELSCRYRVVLERECISERGKEKFFNLAREINRATRGLIVPLTAPLICMRVLAPDSSN